MVKTFRNPATETASCWGLSALAAMLGAASVGAWEPVLLAYPMYLAMLYIGVLSAMWMGRRQQRKQTKNTLVPLLLHPDQRVDRPSGSPHLQRAA